MSIFRRRDKSAAPDPSAVDDETGGEPEVDADVVGGPDSDAVGAVDDGAVVARSGGPYDSSEVAGAEGRLDLGSLWVAGLPGMELRLEVDEPAQQVLAVNAVLGDSAVHLQAFAAPRTAGIWDEIRQEIASSITRQGGTADEATGPLGTELRAQMPSQGPGGRVVLSPARFLGVDGPRWFLRAVLSGRAAQDESAAQPLVDVVRETVVVRGDEAMAPRELLPLQLPEVEADPDAPGLEGAAGFGEDDEYGEDRPVGEDGAVGEDRPFRGASEGDFRPFERGPEITEIR